MEKINYDLLHETLLTDTTSWHADTKGNLIHLVECPCCGKQYDKGQTHAVLNIEMYNDTSFKCFVCGNSSNAWGCFKLFGLDLPSQYNGNNEFNGMKSTQHVVEKDTTIKIPVKKDTTKDMHSMLRIFKQLLKPSVHELNTNSMHSIVAGTKEYLNHERGLNLSFLLPSHGVFVVNDAIAKQNLAKIDYNALVSYLNSLNKRNSDKIENEFICTMGGEYAGINNGKHAYDTNRIERHYFNAKGKSKFPFNGSGTDAVFNFVNMKRTSSKAGDYKILYITEGVYCAMSLLSIKDKLETTINKDKAIKLAIGGKKISVECIALFGTSFKLTPYILDTIKEYDRVVFIHDRDIPSEKDKENNILAIRKYGAGGRLSNKLHTKIACHTKFVPFNFNRAKSMDDLFVNHNPHDDLNDTLRRYTKETDCTVSDMLFIRYIMCGSGFEYEIKRYNQITDFNTTFDIHNTKHNKFDEVVNSFNELGTLERDEFETLTYDFFSKVPVHVIPTAPIV